MAEHEHDLRVNTLIRLVATVRLSEARYRALADILGQWMEFDRLEPDPPPPDPADSETIADLEQWLERT